MIPTRPAPGNPGNSHHRHPRGPIITHYRGLHPLPPEAIPRQTEAPDVPTYLHECQTRRARGWSPHYPATLAQGVAAYRRGLITYRPAEGEPERAAYDAIDQRRDWQRRYLAMLDDDQDLRAEVARRIQGGQVR